MVDIVAAHGGHLWGSSTPTIGVAVLSMALLVLVAIALDRRR